jgi:hypothetical protein
MIRRVAMGKAVLAGSAGAVTWEAVMRPLILFGWNGFDIVRLLGTMVLGADSPAVFWWPIGIVLHALVGSIWAIFYAYFFWSITDLRPVFQGILFCVLPALLAGAIMVPQLDHMHAAILNGVFSRNGMFAYILGWAGPAGIFLGHLIYGAVLGSLYTKPVGYRTGKKIILHG